METRLLETSLDVGTLTQQLQLVHDLWRTSNPILGSYLHGLYFIGTQKSRLQLKVESKAAVGGSFKLKKIQLPTGLCKTKPAILLQDILPREKRTSQLKNYKAMRLF